MGYAHGDTSAGSVDALLQASGPGSIALGYASGGNKLQATGTASVSIGQDVQTTANNAFALGSSFINSTASTFKVGFSSTPTLTVSSTTVSIGTTTISRTLTVAGSIRATGALYGSNNSAGSNGYVLKSTGTGFQWVATSTLGLGGMTSADIDTCAELAAIMSGETGTCGSLVLSASPTFTGTVNAAALTLSSTLTLSGNTASRALFLDSSSRATTTAASAALANAITDETGSGSLVFSASPTFTGTLNAGNINITQYSSYQQNGATILYASSTASSTRVGFSAGSALLSGGIYNTAVGQSALKIATSSDYNTAIGAKALTANRGANYNTAVGAEALQSNTIGTFNSAFGYDALNFNTKGAGNTALGATSLYHNISGNYNTAVGDTALYFNYSATSTVAVGYGAGYGGAPFNYSNQGGVYLGYESAYNVLTGSDYNTIIGYQAGYNVSTGANNIILGAATSTTGGITTGSNNILVGNGVRYGLTNTGNNQLNIGNLLFGTGLATGNNLSPGKIGIGTSSPASKLDVWGNFRVGTSSTPALLVNTGNGKVGVGTSSILSSAKFVVNGRAQITDGLCLGSYQAGCVGYTTHNGYLGFGDGGTNYIYDDGSLNLEGVGIIQSGGGSINMGDPMTFNAQQMEFEIGGVMKMELGNNGSVAIGTTSATFPLTPPKLNVWGSLRVGTSSTPTLFVNTGNGRLGIGTSTPSQALTVAGSIRATGALYGSNNSAGSNGYVLKSTGTGFAWVATSTLGITGGLTSGDIDTCSELAAIMTGETGTCGSLVLSASPTFTGTVSAAALTLSSTLSMSGSSANIALGSNYLSGDGGDEGIFVDGSGKIGIGTTTPAYELTIDSTDPYTGVNIFTDDTTQYSNAAIDLQNTAVASGNRRVTMMLEKTEAGAGGTSWFALRHQNYSGTSDHDFLGYYMNGASSALYLESLGELGITSGSGDIDISTNGSERMTIKSSGSVGIGTTTSARRLSVYDSGSNVIALFRAGFASSVIEFSDSDSTSNPYLGSLGNSLQFGTNGSQRMIINSSGNVGIGTTSPSAKLSVATDDMSPYQDIFTINSANGHATSSLVFEDGGYLNITSDTWSGMGVRTSSSTWWGGAATSEFYLGSSRGTPASPSATQLDDTIGSFNFTGYGTSTWKQAAAITALAAANFTNTSMPGHLQFSTTPTGSFSPVERMRITSSGKVGIGTTSPSAKLSVALSYGETNGTAFKISSSTGSATTTLFSVSRTGVTEINSSYLGLTNSAAAAYLNITGAGAGNSYANIELASAAGPYWFLSHRTGNDFGIYYTPDDVTYYNPLHIEATTPSNTLYLDSSGKIGIGTTSPASKLDVWGNLRIGTSSTPTLLANTGSGRVGIASSSPSALLSINTTNRSGKAFIISSSTEIQMYVAADADTYLGAGALFIDAFEGLVGIGTTTPLTNLNEELVITNEWTGSSDTLIGLSRGTTKYKMGIESDNNFVIENLAESTEYLSIVGSTGKVGIGTSSPSQALTVAGSIRATGALYGSNNSAGSNGYVLKSTGTGFQWVATSTLGLGGGGLASTDIDTCAELAAIMTGETGTCGSLVLSASPTFTGTVNMASLRATASSTIGGGTGATGLTISGGATTTGNAYFGGNVSVAAGKSYLYDGAVAFTASTSLDNYFLANAGNLTMTGGENLGFGSGALFSNASGTNNIAIGTLSLLSNTGGTDNIALGVSALQNNATGTYNTAVGSSAMASNRNGSHNVAFGAAALTTNQFGSYNTAIGEQSLYYLLAGTNNTALGTYALQNHISASGTVALGVAAGQGAGFVSDQGSTYIGYKSGVNVQTGSDYNTLLGYQSGYNLSTGANNIVIGAATSTTGGITTGSNNILLGLGVRYGLSNTGSRQLNIGNLLFGTSVSSGNTLSSGKIGIGTSSPASKLDVWGNLRVGTSSTPTLYANTGNGRVGIGTTTAQYPLTVTGGTVANSIRVAAQIYGSTYPTLQIKSSDTSGGNLQLMSSTGQYQMYIGGTTLRWYNGSSDVMSLSNGGSLVLGTTTPTAKLHLHDNTTTSGPEIRFTNNTTLTGTGDGLEIGLDGSEQGYVWNYENTDLYFATNNQTQMTLSAGSKVGIGTTTPNTRATIVSDTASVATFGNSLAGGARWTLYVGDNGSTLSAGTLGFGAGPGSSGNSKFVLDSSGNVGIGTITPTQKLTVAGSILLKSQAEAAVSWGTGYNGSQESITAMTEFNGYLYAGQGNGTGDGDVLICDPAGGGNTSDCDNAADWSTSMDGSQEVIWGFAEYKGKLYAGQGSTLASPTAGDGDIFVCNPATTGNALKCDSGDWSTAYNSASYEMIFAMAEFNGKLYAAPGITAGDGDILVCNPDTAGTAGICDNASDWTLAYDGAQEGFAALASFQGRLYAGQGTGAGDGDVLMSSDGSTWATSFNGSQEYIRALTVYNNKLYLGQNQDAGDNDVYMTPDGVTWTMSYNGAQEWLNALTVYNGSIYAAQGNSTGDGDIFTMTGSSTWSTSYNGSQEEITSFAVYNGKLYAGQGNSTGDGDVLYMNQAATTSYPLRFAAGNSEGTLWFSDESLWGAAGPNGEVGVFKMSHALVTTAGSFDVAEDYPTADKSLEPGDIVAYDTRYDGYLKKASKDDRPLLAGVVSGQPGFLLSSSDRKGNIPTALVGRVPVKATAENGEIAIGDSVTISNTQEGTGMKANFGDKAIGYALEPLSSDEDSGTILIYVSPHYAFGMNPDPAILGEDGAATSTAVLAGRTILDRMIELANGFVGGVLSTIGIQTTTVNTANLCVGAVCVDEATFLKMVENSGAAPTDEPPVPTEPDPQEEDGDDGGETASSTDPVTEEETEETASSTDPIGTDGNASSTPLAEPEDSLDVADSTTSGSEAVPVEPLAADISQP
jgi:hypothetical protein